MTHHHPEEPADAETRFAIDSGGLGVTISWKVLISIIVVVAIGAIWCASVQRALGDNSVAISELRHRENVVDSKVNALLIDRRIDPRQFERERESSSSDGLNASSGESRPSQEPFVAIQSP
jgi:hypothetical protein